MLEWPYLLLLVVAAFVGGAQNAVAGGGSFLTFPSLVAAGIGSKAANATSTVALWPGSLASAFGFRRDVDVPRRVLRILAAVSAAGGAAGAALLLWTPELTFDRLVPFLMAAATAIFAFGPPISRHLHLRHAHDGPMPSRKLAVFAGVQFGVGLYGGYFGGGIGIVMLATFAAMGMEDVHAANGLKAILGSLVNGVAIAWFAVSGLVVWPVALLMVAGSVAGGYLGARLSRRVAVQRIRVLVIWVGCVLTAAFFWKAFG